MDVRLHLTKPVELKPGNTNCIHYGSIVYSFHSDAKSSGPQLQVRVSRSSAKQRNNFKELLSQEGMAAGSMQNRASQLGIPKGVPNHKESDIHFVSIFQNGICFLQ